MIIASMLLRILPVGGLLTDWQFFVRGFPCRLLECLGLGSADLCGRILTTSLQRAIIRLILQVDKQAQRWKQAREMSSAASEVGLLWFQTPCSFTKTQCFCSTVHTDGCFLQTPIDFQAALHFGPLTLAVPMILQFAFPSVLDCELVMARNLSDALLHRLCWTLCQNVLCHQ